MTTNTEVTVTQAARELCDLIYAHHVIKYDPAAAQRCAKQALEAFAQTRTRFTTAPGQAVQEALQTAISHIEHMAAWIGAQRAGYSFESLGEDMPDIKAALQTQPAAVNGRETEAAAWDYLNRTFGDMPTDPLDRTYDAEEMVKAFHAGAHALQPAARDVVDRWADVIPLVEKITAEEGASVTFVGPNPDFNGLPGEAIIVTCGPHWKESFYRADTLADCLRAALTHSAQA